MKNIHVIATDKPGKLLSIEDRLTIVHSEFFSSQYIKLHGYQSKSMYITSEEKIKEGDYVTNGKYVSQATNEWWTKFYIGNPELKADYWKIILTTDLDLIKDGVQAIDDEFLEWFVKNPSCESIEVEEEDYSQKCRECGEIVKRGYSCNRGCFMQSGNFILTDKNINYKIITPKEEPKQETLEEKLDKIVSKEPSKFWKESDERFLTLKIKYQEERMYSEEEVELIAYEMVNWAIDNIGNINPQSGKKFDEIIQTFKKN